MLEEISSRRWFNNILRSLIAAGVPLIGLGGCDCPPDDRLYLIRETDESIAPLVQACRRPVNPDCRPLCEFVSNAYAIVHCELHSDKDGYLRVHVGSEPSCTGGRRPSRLRFADGKAGPPVAQWLARMSQLEAASVPAFRRLARQLRHHEAPLELVEAARAAARDEIRHARALRAIVRSHGIEPGVPRCPAEPRLPSLAQLARANEVEGCVRESFGALVAAHQGAVAGDTRVRAAMSSIAPDELRHATLARAIRSWALPQLSPRQRAGVAQAGARELRRLAHARSLPEYVRTQLGFPCRENTWLILQHLAEDLA